MSDTTLKKESMERYLCFNLGTEEFAIPLLFVKEVIAMPEITTIPQAPSYFLGIMNLRGQVISVMDLRSKLGIKPSQASETSIIICDLQPNSIGVVVDTINSVLNPQPGSLSPRPDMQSSKAADFITGVYQSTDRLVLVLDIASTLKGIDQKTIRQAAGMKAA